MMWDHVAEQISAGCLVNICVPAASTQGH